MKIAVSCTKSDMDAEVDPRLGRCPFLLIVNPEDMSFEAVANTSAALAQGAGIQVARLLADKGVSTVLTGHCGPNACEALNAAGIGVVTACAGPVRNIVERFKSGELQSTAGATAGPQISPAADTGAGSSSAPTGGVMVTGAGRDAGGGGRGHGHGHGRGFGGSGRRRFRGRRMDGSVRHGQA